MSVASIINELRVATPPDSPAHDIEFDPAPFFGAWLQAVESSRHRKPAQRLPGAYLDNGNSHFDDVLSFYDHFEDKVSANGALVVTEDGSLQAEVEVTSAVIDGVFKGSITATESVVVNNHAVVIGDIHTPKLTIRGGAIIEGTCRLEALKAEDPQPPERATLKVGFAKVWRSRIFQ